MRRNAFDIHTSAMEEIGAKIFYILGDMNIFRDSRRRAYPSSEGEILAVIADCKMLSSATREAFSSALKSLAEVRAEEGGLPRKVRDARDAGCAIIYGSQSRADLDRGLQLIDHLFPDEGGPKATRAVRELIQNGEGRIYGKGDEQFAVRSRLPQAVYSIRSNLKADAAGAFGAVVSGKVDPRVIAGIALAASAAAACKDLMDSLFPEDVPLFPGGTGPYNPYPNPS